MSVLHILSSLQIGGAERFTIDLVQVQRKLGFDARILSLGEEDDILASAATELGIPITVCVADQGRFKRYGSIASILRKSDVVHFHSPFALRFLMPLIFLFPWKTYIYTRHGIYELNTWSWRITHQVLRPFIKYVTFVTKSGMDVFAKYHKWDEKRLKVIENGVYIPPQKSRAVRSPIRFGSVGRMVGLKGQSFLLDTVRDMIENLAGKGSERTNLEVHFYGTGPMEAELRRKAAAIPDSVAVHFHGIELDHERIYDNIDVLVICSNSEGLSLVIMEAMARSVPVIATNVGGNSTLVDNNITGILFDAGDGEALTAAMERVIKDSSLVEAMGRASRAKIVDQFSLERTQAAYSILYGA